MYQLTYISTVRRGGAAVDVDAILAKSRRNNARHGITGILVFDGVRFLQALEGAPEDVRATYARIRDDERHRAPVILSEREVAHREFGKWDMACERVRATGSVGLIETVDALVGSLADKNMRALFSSFVRLDRTAA